MKSTTLPLPEVGALALTRALLGAGMGLLVADRLDPVTRRRAGGTLLAVGLVTTVPVVVSIVRGIGSPGAPSADRALAGVRA